MSLQNYRGKKKEEKNKHAIFQFNNLEIIIHIIIIIIIIIIIAIISSLSITKIGFRREEEK